MPDKLTQSDLTLLVDHANVPFADITLRALLIDWIQTLDLQRSGTFSVRVRAYGGWFDQEAVTDDRFHAAEFYQRECPSIFEYGDRFFRLSFEFADHLLSAANSERKEPVRISHSVVTRPIPQYIKLRPGQHPCPESDCELMRVRKWIKKKKACARTACPMRFSDFFCRTEQKQVDVHLAIDILTSAQNATPGQHIGVASNDWDLLPAIAAGLQRATDQVSVSLIKSKPDPTYLDGFLLQQGGRIVLVKPRLPEKDEQNETLGRDTE